MNQSKERYKNIPRTFMKIFSDYEKIMQVLDAKSISISKAEALAGFGTGIIGKLNKRKKGKGSMHPDNTTKFLRTFKVNQSWWDTGEGEMFLKEPDAPPQPEKTNGTITMEREVWGVIKLCTEILGAEFVNLWDHIHELTPSKPGPKTAETINEDKTNGK